MTILSLTHGQQNNQATSHTIPLPTGTAVGDMVFMMIGTVINVVDKADLRGKGWACEADDATGDPSREVRYCRAFKQMTAGDSLTDVVIEHGNSAIAYILWRCSSVDLHAVTKDEARNVNNDNMQFNAYTPPYGANIALGGDFWWRSNSSVQAYPYPDNQVFFQPLSESPGLLASTDSRFTYQLGDENNDLSNERQHAGGRYALTYLSPNVPQTRKLEVNQAGTWIDPKEIYVRQGGVWTPVKEAFIRDGGTWHKVFGDGAGGDFNLQYVGVDESADGNSWTANFNSPTVPAGRRRYAVVGSGGIEEGSSFRIHTMQLNNVDMNLVSASTSNYNQYANIGWLEIQPADTALSVLVDAQEPVRDPTTVLWVVETSAAGPVEVVGNMRTESAGTQYLQELPDPARGPVAMFAACYDVNSPSIGLSDDDPSVTTDYDNGRGVGYYKATSTKGAGATPRLRGLLLDAFSQDTRFAWIQVREV